MKLYYKNNLLEQTSDCITSSDFLVKLSTDITDATYLGIVLFKNGTKKVLNFVPHKQSNGVAARLIISSDELKLLDETKFYLEILNGDVSKYSNIINLYFDIDQIKLDIKVNTHNEYKNLVEKIAMLESKINLLTKNNVLTQIPLTNKKTIKKGMMPVAIDDNGNFAALYPFSNHVTEINGQTAANGAVLLDATMIKYKKKDTSIEEVLDNNSIAIVEIASLIKTLSTELVALRKSVDALDYKLQQHITNGII